MIVRDSNGHPVALVEVVQSDPALAEQLAAMRGASPDLAGDLRRVGEGIAETCRQIMESVKGTAGALAPDELELTFGVKIGAEGGIPLITRSSGEATLEVKAKWGTLGIELK